ncbi:MAG: ABC transporter permease [Clostridia bacterium]
MFQLKRSLRAFSKNIKECMGILIGLVVMCILLMCMTDKFLTASNLFNIIRQITINTFLACGMTLVILLGGIDLSVGSVIAVSGCISAGMATWLKLPIPVAILIGISSGVAIGSLNGLIASFTNIPPFIITLATMNIGRGIARLYTGAKTIAVLNPMYTFFGTGKIAGIPIQLFLIVAVVAVTSFILNKTKLGRGIYYVGDNEQSAKYAGLKVRKIRFFVFLFSGILAAMAGVLSTSRTFAATMDMGISAEMDAIAAVVLGGTSMSGGRGTLTGTLLGVVLLAFLQNGLTLLSVSSYWHTVFSGAIILVSISATAWNEKRKLAREL